MAARLPLLHKTPFVLDGRPLLEATRRRAPKVTVTREGVSLCQKGVTPWLLFLVNCLWALKRVKTSRGASCEPLARAPLRSKTDALPRRGDRGEVWWPELFTSTCATLHGPWFAMRLVPRPAHRRDRLHAPGHGLF